MICCEDCLRNDQTVSGAVLNSPNVIWWLVSVVTVEYNRPGTSMRRAVCQCTEGHVPRDNIHSADIRRPSDCVKAKGTLSTFCIALPIGVIDS